MNEEQFLKWTAQHLAGREKEQHTEHENPPCYLCNTRECPYVQNKECWAGFEEWETPLPLCCDCWDDYLATTRLWWEEFGLRCQPGYRQPVAESCCKK